MLEGIMSTIAFDPEKFIGREYETELFEELLQFNHEARMLAIQDKEGTGKSHLLASFQYRCLTIWPRIPVSFTPLHELKDARPYGLIAEIAQDLTNIGLKLPQYTLYNDWLLSGDFTPLFRASNPKFSIPFQAETLIVTSDPKAFTPQQQEYAEDKCIDAFFDDLTKSAAEVPVVLIFDTYEQCEEKLKDWIEECLLENYFFNLDKRPKKLLLVVAGRQVPNFKMRWGTDYTDVVSSVNELGKWTRERIEEYLKVHGFNYSPEQLDVIWRMAENDVPLAVLITMMDSVLQVSDHV
jgi:hypothetical protein